MRFSIIQLKQLSEDSEVSGNKLRNFKLLAFLEGAGIVYTGRKGGGGSCRMRARSREWDGFRMTSIVGSVVLCALGHVYPITRAFICTRRRFRFARSIPHTRPDVIRIRIVSSSALQDAWRIRYSTGLRPSAQLVHRPVISRGETNAGSQVFLIAHPRRILRRSSYRFQSSIGEESSALFYARLTLVSSPLQTDPS